MRPPKGEVGASEYEVRSWTARHLVDDCQALATLSAVRAAHLTMALARDVPGDEQFTFDSLH